MTHNSTVKEVFFNHYVDLFISYDICFINNFLLKVNGRPVLSSDSNPSGISIFNGCYYGNGTINPDINPDMSIEDEFTEDFQIENNPKVQESLITLADQYDIISSLDIKFTVTVRVTQN